MRGKNPTWVVSIPRDEQVPLALLSGEMLKRTQTSASIIALITTSVTPNFITPLRSVFDMVVVTEKMKYFTTNGIAAALERDGLLAESLGLSAFTKLVLINPGVLVLRPSDELFEEDGVVLDRKGQWKIASITPEFEKYEKVLQILKAEQPFTAETLQMVFSANFAKECVIPYSDLKYHARCGQKVSFTEIEYNEDIKLELDMKFDGLWKQNLHKDVERIIKSVKNPFVLPQLEAPKNENQDQKDWIAIVGMSCRFPQANSVEEYWEILKTGQNTCTTPPAHRTSLSDVDKDIRANFLKCRVDEFDSSFFGITAAEAVFTDAQARLLLEVSWEAFQDAGIDPTKLKNSPTGVFYGSWLQEYKEVMNVESPPNEEFLRKYLGNGFGCSAAKLSFFYGFTGPNVATESGCSSSIVAVDLACKSLQRGECPVALASGANILLQVNLTKKVVWAEDGCCRTFDANANGYGRAEGVGVLVLKRYSDAIRDNDRIHGIIRGSWTSQEGLSRSFGTPTLENESKVMKKALEMAKVDACDVDYVEAHATGTGVGDPIEAAAIVQAYSSPRPRAEPLFIGSGKTNIGHTESCSGIAGIIKVLLAMKHELIPAHINLETLNPKVNFESIPGIIPLEPTKWKSSLGKPRIAGVSSFGITGTDVHMILQQAPATYEHQIQEKPQLHILTLSAKTPDALQQLTASFGGHLQTTHDDIANIAYTGNACRTHHRSQRRAIIGRSSDDIATQINNKNYVSGTSKLEKPKICFTFPGVIGNMNLESPKELYHTSPVFRTNIDYCDSVFNKMTGLSLSSFLMKDYKANPAEERSKEWYACIFAIQYSLFKVWESWNVQPDYVMGHCLGEIVTAVVAGALKLEDGFSMIMAVQHFSEANKGNPGSMLALMCDHVTATGLIGSFLKTEDTKVHWLEVASINSPTQTVIAGASETILNFKNFCKSKNFRCKQITVDFAIHSRAIEPALVKCEDIASKLQHGSIKIPYISSVTGSLVQEKDLNPQYWFNCFRNAVQFTSACNVAEHLGCEIYIEVGLGPELSKLVEENVMEQITTTSLCLPSFQKTGDKGWSGILSSLAQLYISGVEVDWEAFYRFYSNKKVSLPHYPFERKSFWFARNNKKHGNNRAISDIKQLHPLLGGHLSNALDCQIFQNFMSDWKAPYVYDHVIGSEVIFPAAGFLEMILSAGHFSACNGQQNKEGMSLQVEDFVVHHPLLVEMAVEKKMQTVLNSGGTRDEDQITSRFTVHSQSERDEWCQYASGIFTHLEQTSGEGDVTSFIDAGDIKSKFQSSDDVTSKFYKQAAQAGLNFGPEFQSLKTVYQGERETLAEVNIPEGSTSYICHPILIDAMIQCFILHTKPELRKLHVPVRIGKFICHPSLISPLLESAGNSSSPVFNIYCKTEISGQTNAVYLLDYEGNILCSMLQPQLAETTVEAVLAAAGALSKNAGADMPNIYEVFWKQSTFFQSKGSLNLSSTEDITTSPSFKSLLQNMEKSNKFTTDEKELDTNVNRLCYLYILKALYDFGWKPEVKEIFNADHLAYEFKILPAFLPAFKHFVTFLIDNGILDSQYILKTLPESEKAVANHISTLREILKDYGPVDIIHSCGTQMAQVLQGSVTGQYILFGNEKDGQNQAEIFYKTTRLHEGMFQAPAKVFNEISQQMWTNGRTNKSHDTLRILEVGAGTGSFTSEVLPILEEQKINYEYFFTDISQSFFSRANAKFSEYSERIVFKLLDIEKDPMKQGFPPGYFDIVVGVDVFHATRKLNHTVRNIQLLTRKNGMVIIGETDVPTKELDIVFGILDGYWLFEDNIRSSHCTITTDKWIDLLKENGFGSSLCKIFATNNQMSVITGKLTEVYNHDGIVEDNNLPQWLVIHDDRNEAGLGTLVNQMKTHGRSVQLLSLSRIADEILHENLQNYLHELLETSKPNLEGILCLIEGSTLFTKPNSRVLLEPLLLISKFLMQSRFKTLPKFHIATKGVWCNGDENAIFQSSPASGSLWGYMRNARIEIPGIKSKSIDLDPDDELYNNLFEEMWLDDGETEILYRSSGTRSARRLRNDSLKMSKVLSVPISEGNKYTIKLPNSKVLSDLEYIPKVFGKVEENQVEIEVRCASLNFKDVLNVMKPSKEFENFNNIGLDYSGVISSVGSKVSRWKVGDRVFGCSWEDGTITSHIFSDPDFIMPIPDSNVTFSEAATLPAVFLTAWYCMVDVANLQPGQSILVHAASGGVGLISIQVAKILGVTVIGTAGSPRKRNYLKSIGVEHVFNSRNLDYESKIKEITKGKGVDMILNCLTGPGFKEASLEVCKDGGHFVEISKLDIWQPEEVKSRRPNVNYNIVDVMQVEPTILQDIMKRLTTYLEMGTIKPLPYTRYSGSTILDALTYLQKAKQIGKVIVDMPRYVVSENQFREYLFNDKSTYIITGGKGAIGMAVAKWMVSQGAKYLVLVGRSPPKAEALKEISSLQELGATVLCKEVDISDYSQCKELLDNIQIDKLLPPIRGIHHCSGVLSDKMIVHQDWNNFEYVLAPKVKGAYNLHLLTMGYPLEFFVVYSSMATTFGNIGQSNYTAANAYMDSLVEMRNAMGLKGMTINWGVWKAGLAENLELDWADPFSINQGINALHKFFHQNRISAVAGNIKFNEIIKMTPYFEKTLLEHIDLTPTSHSSRSRGKSESGQQESRKINFVELYSKIEGDEEKQVAVFRFVVDVLCETLGVKEHEVNTDVNFQDMGMDSLLSIEFSNKLQSELGDVALGFVDMEIHGSVPKMTELIISVLECQISS